MKDTPIRPHADPPTRFPRRPLKKIRLWVSASVHPMNLDFKYTSDGLVPAIVREATPPGRVLMMGWMNRQSLAKTLETGLMHFWSRSRKQLWLKGETSGHTQRLIRWFTDCDRDTLLFEVEQRSGACHTGYRSCFFQELDFIGEPMPVKEEKLFDPEQVYKK
jgi:phosphoribosyl-AMP cyclohydrolase